MVAGRLKERLIRGNLVPFMLEVLAYKIMVAGAVKNLLEVFV